MTKEINELYYDRDKLYSEVWNQTIVSLCRQYEVSHSEIVKACELLNVPRPSVGYWTQKECGKAPQVPALPSFNEPPLVLIHPPEKEKKKNPECKASLENFETQVQKLPELSPEKIIQEPEVELIKNNEEAVINNLTLSEIEIKTDIAQTTNVNTKLKISKWLEYIPPKDCVLPEAFEEAIKLIEKEAHFDMAITLPAEMEKEHPYVKNTRLEFEKKIKNKSVNSLDRCLYNCYGKDMFDVEVAADSIQRALNILQALCNAFEKRGFDLVSEWDEKNGSGYISVIIMGEKLTFLMTESLNKVKLEEKDKYGYSKYDYTSTGLLTLKNLSPPDGMKCPHWCNDKHKSLLEDKLYNFIIGLIIASAWEKENKAIKKKREEEWKRSEELRKEKERIAKQNKLRIDNFNKATEYWKQYYDMSAFLSMVKNEYRKSGKKNRDTAKWIKWASDYLVKYKCSFEDLVRYDVSEYKDNTEYNQFISATVNPAPSEPYNYWQRPWYQRLK